MLNLLRGVFNIAKKIFLIIAVYFIVFSLFSYFSDKDKIKNNLDPIKQNRNIIYKNINDPKMNSSNEGKVSIAIYQTIMCSIVGEGCTNNPADGEKNYPNSLTGVLSGLVAMPFVNPPASGLYWAYSGLQNAGFIPKTYAAEGMGFASIRPLMNLWKVFRDISYMLLVFVLIGIGFMIMLRMKLNPQTVISVENALPKIVISLILITFSFAIVGFLIDLMYIVIAIIISAISNNGMYYNVARFQNDLLNAGFGKLGTYVIPDPRLNTGGTNGLFQFGMLISIGNGIFGLLPTMVNTVLRSVIGGLASLLLWTKIYNLPLLSPVTDATRNITILGTTLGHLPAGIVGTIIAAITGAIAFAIGYGWVPQIILAIIFTITVFVLVFRIFFLLLRTYLDIILLTIISPFILLFEAVPGKNAFSFWFKTLFAEIMTFPIVIAIFLIGYVLVNTLSAPTGGVLWTPPFLYGMDSNAFSMFLGMGIILMTPDLVKMARELMGVKPLPLAPGIGSFFGGVGAVGGGGLGLVSQFGSIALGLSNLGVKFEGTAPGVGQQAPQGFIPFLKKHLGGGRP